MICKFCGYLAQVKATRLQEGSIEFPARVMGAAWGPQQEQIISGIYNGLFVVGFTQKLRLVRIDFVPAHLLQVTPEVFEPRNPLSATAKRAGWRGFNYALDKLPPVGIKQIYP